MNIVALPLSDGRSATTTRTTARYDHLADDPVDALNASIDDMVAATIGAKGHCVSSDY